MSSAPGKLGDLRYWATNFWLLWWACFSLALSFLPTRMKCLLPKSQVSQQGVQPLFPVSWDCCPLPRLAYTRTFGSHLCFPSILNILGLNLWTFFFLLNNQSWPNFPILTLWFSSVWPCHPSACGRASVTGVRPARVWGVPHSERFCTWSTGSLSPSWDFLMILSLSLGFVSKV